MQGASPVDRRAPTGPSPHGRLRTLEAVDPASLRGRRVLVRADFNVPLDGEGRVTDETRIRATLPTLRKLVDAGARVAILSHLGRPKGTADPAFSLQPTVPVLARLLGGSVTFSPDTVGTGVQERIAGLAPGDVLVLENTRFLSGETGNDPGLCRELADLGDDYVGDAFGSAHRAHASTEGLPREVLRRGGRAVAGLLLAREVHFLRDALAESERPFVAVIGGAKISGKIDLIQAILPRVDQLLIGGAMANTFFLALGLEVGDSLVEPDRVGMAAALLEEAGDRLVLPVDVRVAQELGEDSSPRTSARDGVRPGERIGDIGPDTEGVYASILSKARTVVWNGPMGVFERTPFASGTRAVALAVAGAGGGGAVTVVGGGDSASAADLAGVTDRLTHLSTGGGAALELLAGEELPGVSILEGGT